jgi:hypothetical protein
MSRYNADTQLWLWCADEAVLSCLRCEDQAQLFRKIRGKQAVGSPRGEERSEQNGNGKRCAKGAN